MRGAIGRGRATVAGHALPATACLELSRERALAAGDQISPKTPTPPHTPTHKPPRPLSLFHPLPPCPAPTTRSCAPRAIASTHPSPTCARSSSSLARNLLRGVSTRIFETRHPRHRTSFRLSRSILFSTPPLSTPRKHSDPPSTRAPPLALLAPQNPSSSLLPFHTSLLPGVRKPPHYVSPPLPPSRQIREFRPHRARLAAVQHTARLLTFVTRSRTPLVHYHHHLRLSSVPLYLCHE